jgi:protein-S-isoprenylcysteine O-methyltransferase Ste14
MKKQTKLSIYGVRYILRMFLQLLFQMGVILATAGTFHVGTQVQLYFILLTGSYIVSLWAIAHRNPEVINERTKNYNVNTKSWDKVLLPLYVIATFLVMNIFIGLDIRYNWLPIDSGYCYAGVVLYLLSVAINTMSLVENKHFEASSRIQTERNHTVVSTGVYSFVRHPGYSSIIIWALSIPLLTGALYAFVPSIFIIVIISIRTYLEDKMLKEGLKGYREYSKKVKYRLIPYVW